MAKTNPQIYLWGWYGHQNSGDDALLVQMSRMLSEVSDDVTAVVQISGGGRLPDLPALVDVQRPSRRFPGHIFLKKMWTILRSEALLFGGGSIMADVTPARLRGLRQKYHICRAAKCRGVPVIFSALGLGPLVSEQGRSLARRTLELADLVDVRDGTSYALCRQLNISTEVVHGFDPAVLMPVHLSLPRKKPPDPGDPMTIGVSPAQSSGTVDDSRAFQQTKIGNLVEAVKRVAASKPLRIATIEMCADDRDGEKQLCRELAKALAGICEVTLIAYDPDPAQMLRHLNGLDLILAERLHAAIYAYSLGVRFAVVPYHSKCSAFAEDVGLPEICRLAPEMPSPQIEKLLRVSMDSPEQCEPSLALDQAQRQALAAQEAVIQKLRTMLGASGVKGV